MMRRQQELIYLSIIGFVLMSLGLLILTPVSHAQSDDREYIGSGDCADCHRDISRAHDLTPHSSALIDVGRDEERVLADFTVGEDVRNLQLPDASEASPITLDDIAYAIGSGQYVQRFLVEVDDDQYMVLPIEWNTQTSTWEPFILAESWPNEAYSWVENCAACHTTGLDIERGRWEDDGVECEACHGPGSEHLDIVEDLGRNLSSRQRRELEGSLSIATDAQTCGQCHSVGTATTDDAPYPIGYFPGGDLLSDFTLVSNDDSTHWWRSGHASEPNMQFNEWLNSSHSTAFTTMIESDYAATACLSCHNASYQRAEGIMLTIEQTDDRSRLERILRDAAIEIDDIDDLTADELRITLSEALAIDPATLLAEEPFLPQILPALLDKMHSEGLLAESTILAQHLDTVMHALKGTGTVEGIAEGITCSSCHTQHNLPLDDEDEDEDAEASVLSPREATYALCIDCHQATGAIAGLHHPAQELFEGLPIVDQVAPIAGAHFTAENGPLCATCHLPAVPVENATRNSHVMLPVLPGMANEGQLDTCTTCHEEQVDSAGMQDLLTSIRSSMDVRLQNIRGIMTEESPTWVTDVITAIEGDGSYGIHNYAYTNALLVSVERELEISPAVAPLVLPQVTPLSSTADIPATQPPAQPTIIFGMTLPSIILLGIIGTILGVATFTFFKKEDRE